MMSIRAIALISVTVGICCFGLSLRLILSPFFSSSAGGEGLRSSLWVVALLLVPTSIPPLMAMIYGVRLFRSPDKTAIKGAIGALSILGSFVLVLVLQLLIGWEVEGNYVLLTTALLALPVDICGSRYAIRELLNASVFPGELVGQGVKGLIAILVGLAYSSAVLGNMADAPLWMPFTPIIVGSISYYALLGIRS